MSLGKILAALVVVVLLAGGVAWYKCCSRPEGNAARECRVLGQC